MTCYAPQNMTVERAMLEDLTDIMRVRRPHDTKSERRFNRMLADRFGLTADPFGNLWHEISTPAGLPLILWSCHLDTVHKHGGVQLLNYEGDKINTRDPQSNCLGADDSAGIWLMLEMIKAGKPGIYVFHRGEEVGGLGSSYIAQNMPQWYERADCAIALDRAGYNDVITHQGYGRSCSDTFADSLAHGLNLSN